MTGTERKRAWRREHPERSREAERQRAQARREGYWGCHVCGQPVTPGDKYCSPCREGDALGRAALGLTRRLCASEGSYRRYELSVRRMLQKMNWRRIGPGSMKMSVEQRAAAGRAYFVARGRALRIEVDGAQSAPGLVAQAFS